MPPVIVACRAHQYLTPFIEFDLERQVFQKGIVDDCGPIHEVSPFVRYHDVLQSVLSQLKYVTDLQLVLQEVFARRREA